MIALRDRTPCSHPIDAHVVQTSIYRDSCSNGASEFQGASYTMPTNRGVAYVGPGQVEVKSIDFPKLNYACRRARPIPSAAKMPRMDAAATARKGKPASKNSSDSI